MPQTQKFITIDVGKAWTKVFLAKISSDNILDIESSSRLPTSYPDLAFSIKSQLNNIKEKDIKMLLVSGLEQAEIVAKNIGADFVKEEMAVASLVEFFKRSGEKVAILDAGASNFDITVDTKEIGKYLSFSIAETALENFLGNKAARPHHLPRNIKELEIEESFFKKIYEDKLAQSEKKKFFLVVTGGLFSDTPDVSRLSLVLLDILKENQIAQVDFDREFFLPSFGALLSSFKRLEIVVPGQWLDRLGSFVSLGGPKNVKLDWGFSQMQEVELSSDEIAFIPAERDQKIEIEFASGREKIRTTCFGGTLGIVLDSRPKPLGLVFAQEASRKKVVAWLKTIQKNRSSKEAF